MLLIFFLFQVLIALKGEDWMTALSKSEGTAMHLLLPTNLSVELQKCLITDDPRLPRLKIIGHLPNVEINITGKLGKKKLIIYRRCSTKTINK